VLVEAVVLLDNAGGAAFGRNRMAAHGINLGNYGNTELGIDLGSGDGSTQSCATTTYEKDIVRRDVHVVHSSGCVKEVAASDEGPKRSIFSY
jgi:hypothetical protein